MEGRRHMHSIEVEVSVPISCNEAGSILLLGCSCSMTRLVDDSGGTMAVGQVSGGGLSTTVVLEVKLDVDRILAIYCPQSRKQSRILLVLSLRFF